MKTALKGYVRKSKKLVDKFTKSFQNKVSSIDPEYQKLKKEVEKLTSEGKDVEAKAAMETQLKELQDFKKEQVATLEKGFADILESYTSAIDRRIENPGEVFNVELSEKGKFSTFPG